jgi:nitroreductase
MYKLLSKMAEALGVKALISVLYDAVRFKRGKNSASKIMDMNREAGAMHLLRLMHSLEKGLALPNPRMAFGTEKAERLLADVGYYANKYGRDDIHDMALSVLREYLEFSGDNIPSNLKGLIEGAIEDCSDVQAGTKWVERADIWNQSRIDFEAFAFSRSSIRQFTGEPVPESDIVDAIRIALKSPSVCNRSCGRAYYSTDPDVLARLLKRQNGNRGFGHLAGAVIVVAADLRAFYKWGERYQGWIDGGLFAMSINYALHAKGYGVCMLNWSAEAIQDFKFRKEFGIPNEHLIVMLMAVGHMPEKLKVAVSPRRDVSRFAFPISK